MYRPLRAFCRRAEHVWYSGNQRRAGRFDGLVEAETKVPPYYYWCDEGALAQTGVSGLVGLHGLATWWRGA